MVRRLLDAGADVHATARAFQMDGRTALHCASSAGHATVAELLLERGAVVDAADASGWTPLFCADHFGVAEVLCRHGADARRQTADGESPLHQAAATGRSAVLRFLLEQGGEADPVRASDGRTPLFLAAAGDRVGDARLLIERGAGRARRTLDGSTLLHVATFDPMLAELLELGLAVDARRHDGATALHEAVRRRELAAARVLLAHGADANAADVHGNRPLHLLATPRPQEPWPKSVLLLFGALRDAGADLAARDGEGRTPLELAEQGGAAGLVALLRPASVAPLSPAPAPALPDADRTARLKKMRARLDHLVDAGDLDGLRRLLPSDTEATADLLQAVLDFPSWGRDFATHAPWFRAAWKGDAAALRVFLEAGAHVDAPAFGADREPWTALCTTAQLGHAEATRVLLDAGADVEGRRTGTGTATPLFLAATPEVMDLLLARGARSDAKAGLASTLLTTAAHNGREEMVRVLLARGVPVDEVDGAGNTPLLLACGAGHVAVVRVLLAAGADIRRRRGTNGPGALHLAATGEVVASLVEAGLDVDDVHTIGDGGETPLVAAVKDDRLEVVAALLERGADPHALAGDTVRGPGDSPLHEAARRGGPPDLARRLLDAGADVNGRCWGTTPLHEAAANEAAEPELIRLLLEHGADPAALDGDGRTALEIAEDVEGSKAVRVLRKAAPARGPRRRGPRA